jgi:hypothetical protein
MRRYPLLDRAIRDKSSRLEKPPDSQRTALSEKLKRRNSYMQNIESGGQLVTASELHMISMACGRRGSELLVEAERVVTLRQRK